jgi:hypothetical protein
MMLIRIWQNDADTGLAKLCGSGFGKVMLIRIWKKNGDPDLAK